MLILCRQLTQMSSCKHWWKEACFHDRPRDIQTSEITGWYTCQIQVTGLDKGVARSNSMSCVIREVQLDDLMFPGGLKTRNLESKGPHLQPCPRSSQHNQGWDRMVQLTQWLCKPLLHFPRLPWGGKQPQCSQWLGSRSKFILRNTLTTATAGDKVTFLSKVSGDNKALEQNSSDYTYLWALEVMCDFTLCAIYTSWVTHTHTHTETPDVIYLNSVQ